MEENSFETIPKTWRIANIRRYIDVKRRVEFGYSPEIAGNKSIAQTKVTHTECQTEIVNPALLVTLPRSKKVEFALRSDNCTYENRVEKDKIEQYTISFAAQYRSDGHSEKFGKFPTTGQYHMLEPLCKFDDDCKNAYSQAMPRKHTSSLPKNLPHHFS